jgi:LDH2 family malate/lactate/ureidoglycolate dehydrogenase
MTTFPRIDPRRLTDFATAVYVAAGVPEADARLVGDSLVQADLWGHPSHGVMRLSWYLGRVRSNVMRAVTEPKLVADARAIAVVDGCDGVGQVLATHAAREATRRAKIYGVGAVAVRNSNHFGTAMYYTSMAAQDGCVAFLSTNASPAMAPWGGREKTVGSNPWSIAAPAGQYAPMMLDIANTSVARGKVYVAQEKGISIPLGWALNAAGEATTDPAEAIAGVFLPMAEHKGYAISVMMDVLSGVLTGSAFGKRVHGPYQTKHTSGCGHLFVALDIEAFQPRHEFDARIEQLIRELKSVQLAKGFDEVFYPGEREARNDARNRHEGLHLSQATLADLGKVAQETGVKSLLPS